MKNPVYYVLRKRLCDKVMVQFGKFDDIDKARQYACAESKRGYHDWSALVYIYSSDKYGAVSVYFHGSECYAV